MNADALFDWFTCNSRRLTAAVLVDAHLAVAG